ncbi:MAG: TPM domain-containing protein [Clostridia bacterium]|nr:TPM domain-containing protein [Clostridia bacterium]
MKRSLCFLTVLALVLTSLTLCISAEIAPRLIDGASLLSDEAADNLTLMLDEISERQGFDIVIVTTDTLDGLSAKEYAEQAYIDGEYLYDGVLLLVSMSEREWYICTSGYGETVFTDQRLDAAENAFLPYLSDADYMLAFTMFAEVCDTYITSTNESEEYVYYDDYDYDYYYDHNYDYDYKESYDIKTGILVSLGVGAVVALIVTLVMRSQLKSVRACDTAHGYTVDGSMSIREKSDMFLYSNVTRVARPKDNNTHSGGGNRGVSHRSSGRSFGGRGGKF